MVRGLWALAAAWLAATVLASAVQAASVASPPPPVEDYGKLPGMQNVTLSPSGQRYAFVATVEGKRMLYVATTDNKPIDSASLGPTKVGAIWWAGDDHLLVAYSNTVNLGMEFTVSKHELGGVVVMDLKHHKTFSVFAGPYQKSVAQTVVGSFGSVEQKGRWYGYFAGYGYEFDKGGGRVKTTEEGRLIADLFKVDLDTGDFTVAVKGQEDVYDWLVNPETGQVAARMRFNERNGDWKILAGSFGGAELASGHSPMGGVSLDGFGQTTSSFLLRLDRTDDDEIEERSFNGGALLATHKVSDTGTPMRQAGTRLWIGSEPIDADSQPKLFDAVAQTKLKGAFTAFPGYIPHLVSYSADFNRMIVFTDGGDDSGTYWIVDIDKRSADVLGSPYPTVRPEHVGPVRWIDYKAADGLEMRGVLTLPPGRVPKKLPLVVMPHGGPEAHDYLQFDYWPQAFAARGYAVFQPNFRGSDGSGNAFRDAGYGQWGRKMQTDVSDGVAELARQGIVDPKRACIAGWSYGGYAALAGVTVQHGLYRCAVSYGGVADLSTMLTYVREGSGGASVATRSWKQFLGVTTTWLTELNDVSPIRLAERADAPILLIHGKEDTVVPVEQSQSMERALRKAGKPVELITLPGADHWLLEEDARVAMLKASVAFVMKNNPPDEAPAH